LKKPDEKWLFFFVVVVIVRRCCCKFWHWIEPIFFAQVTLGTSLCWYFFVFTDWNNLSNLN
jgi:hypothetical protein